MKHSITQARMAVDHLIGFAEHHDLSESIVDAAKHGSVTLAWLERHAELMKALDRLQRERPDLAELFEAFPGSQITDVRPMFPDFSNGADHG